MKSKIGPTIVTFLAGTIMVLEWFLKSPGLKSLAAEMKLWSIVVEAFTLVLGAVNLFRIHGQTVKQRKPGWHGSLFMFASIIVFAAAGIFGGSTSTLYKKMYDSVIGPAGTTVFGLLCFFIFSAGARCIRFKNLDSALILAAVIIVLVAQVPIGEYYLPAFSPVSSWLLNVVNVAGQRGMIIGAAFGAFASALRILVGLERGAS